MSDVTFDIKLNQMRVHQASADPWLVTLVDTGEQTMTGGRLRRVRSYLSNDDFFFTYGDGLANLNLTALKRAHKDGKRMATVTAVIPPARYGALRLARDAVNSFEEKPPDENGWINGGFFLLSPDVIDYIEGDETMWEQGPLNRLAAEGQLTAYFHRGFWQPMDTLREKNQLEHLWSTGNAPWKNW